MLLRATGLGALLTLSLLAVCGGNEAARLQTADIAEPVGVGATGRAAPVSATRRLNWAWDCDDGRYVVSSLRDGTLWLFVDQEGRPMTPVESAGGRGNPGAVWAIPHVPRQQSAIPVGRRQTAGRGFPCRR